VIELVSAARCIGCDRCVDVCPTDVFDRGADRVPVVARQGDCQTCFLCEAYCPVDALFVAPDREPLGAADRPDEAELGDVLGSYRGAIGWGRGRTPGARTAVGPPLRHAPSDPPGPAMV
jgi:NAD-dependent dihydropyrimidine dehydrogenase PreA subunit